MTNCSTRQQTVNSSVLAVIGHGDQGHAPVHIGNLGAHGGNLPAAVDHHGNVAGDKLVHHVALGPVDALFAHGAAGNQFLCKGQRGHTRIGIKVGVIGAGGPDIGHKVEGTLLILQGAEGKTVTGAVGELLRRALELGPGGGHFQTGLIQQVLVVEQGQAVDAEGHAVQLAVIGAGGHGAFIVAQQRKELDKAQGRMGELNVLFRKLYEDNALGKLSDEQFAFLTSGYDEEKKTLTRRIAELSQELDTATERSADVKKFVALVHKHTKVTELTYENVHEFIDRILIHELDKETNTRKIEIFYSFVGRVDTGDKPTESISYFRQIGADVKSYAI